MLTGVSVVLAQPHLFPICSDVAAWPHSLVCPTPAVPGIIRLTLSEVHFLEGADDGSEDWSFSINLDGALNSTTAR